MSGFRRPAEGRGFAPPSAALPSVFDDVFGVHLSPARAPVFNNVFGSSAVGSTRADADSSADRRPAESDGAEAAHDPDEPDEAEAEEIERMFRPPAVLGRSFVPPSSSSRAPPSVSVALASASPPSRAPAQSVRGDDSDKLHQRLDCGDGVVYASIFDFEELNRMQDQCCEKLFKCGDNFVCGAPTGSGKTILFELAILRMLRSQVRRALEQRGEGEAAIGGAEALRLRHQLFSGQEKVIYCAPMRALVGQRLQDWRPRLGRLGLRCYELSDGVESSRLLSEVQAADVILTTPEKLDALTRQREDYALFLDAVKLLAIDEVHLLAESPRGATLEAILSRMQRAHLDGISDQSEPLRIVALSATLPNVEDLAHWLRSTPAPIGDSEAATPSTTMCTCARFDDSFRPVPLEVDIVGYPDGKNEFLFERSLNKSVCDVMRKYGEGKPVLIFCATRNGTKDTATILAKSSGGAQGFGFGFGIGGSGSGGNRGAAMAAAQQAVRQAQTACAAAARDAHDVALRLNLPLGVGFHHAGLSREDRASVEELFRRGLLPVLCATSTLAMGVNLPAQLVIIKSTLQYQGGSAGYCEYSATSVLQMVGRAGRPGFDDDGRGVAVIMTRAKTTHLYERLYAAGASGMPVESCLHRNLTEVLNTEIALGRVGSEACARRWLATTFLAARMFSNEAVAQVYLAQLVQMRERDERADIAADAADDGDTDDADATSAAIEVPAGHDDIAVSDGTSVALRREMNDLVRRSLCRLAAARLIKVQLATDARPSSLAAACDSAAPAAIATLLTANPSAQLLPEKAGILMSRCYLKMRTSAAIAGIVARRELLFLPPAQIAEVVLWEMCRAEELQRPLKRSEKNALNKLNAQLCYPLTAGHFGRKMKNGGPSKAVAKIQSARAKALVLLQAALGGLKVDDWSLRADQTRSLEEARRVVGALLKRLVDTQSGRVAAIVIRLQRSFVARCWDGLLPASGASRSPEAAAAGKAGRTPSPKPRMLAQISGIGPALLQKLQTAGIGTFADARDASAPRLEALLGKPVAKSLKDALVAPRFCLGVQQSKSRRLDISIRVATDGNSTLEELSTEAAAQMYTLVTERLRAD